MTQEDKDLLLKDICARLPYGVMVHFEGWNPEKLLEINLQIDVFNAMGGLPIPYLRPIESMTMEEQREYISVGRGMSPDNPSILADWLNDHHFDYRGLIQMDLAIKASERMYKTE